MRPHYLNCAWRLFQPFPCTTALPTPSDGICIFHFLCRKGIFQLAPQSRTPENHITPHKNVLELGQLTSVGAPLSMSASMLMEGWGSTTQQTPAALKGRFPVNLLILHIHIPLPLINLIEVWKLCEKKINQELSLFIEK